MRGPKIKIEPELQDEVYNDLYHTGERLTYVNESKRKFARKKSESLQEWVDRLSPKKRWIHTIHLDKYNRMVRIGFGKNSDSWVFRIDLWFIGFRISRY